MRFAFIDDYRPAVVADRGVVDVSHVLDSIPKLDAQDLLEGLVQRFDEFRPLLEEAAANGEATPVDQVRFRPPVPRPGKMVCMAGNYLEGGTIPRAYDVDAFLKAPSSVIGDGDTVVLPNVPAAVFHHEAELGVVIGKEMKSVDASDALSHVFGYLNFMDVSARGITPNGNNSFWWQKSWDTFGPIGPWIVTADEIATPRNYRYASGTKGTFGTTSTRPTWQGRLPKFSNGCRPNRLCTPATLLLQGPTTSAWDRCKTAKRWSWR